MGLEDAGSLAGAHGIRAVRPADRNAALQVVAAAELLDDDGLTEVAGELDATLRAQPGAGSWLVDTADPAGTAAGGQPAGVAFVVPERMTAGTWNLLMLAVHPDHQGRGRGHALVRAVEAELRSRGARLLVVETSGTDAFAGQRRFYAGLGYRQQRWIEDYYEPGDAKVVYARALAAPSVAGAPPGDPTGVRAATRDDHDAVLDLATAFYAEDGFATARPALSTSLAGLLTSSAARVAVAPDPLSGRPAAFAVTTTTFGLENGLVAELEDLYVVPGSRRGGIGRLLVEDAATWARSRGCTTLEVVVAPNGHDVEHLHRYYATLGFADDGRRVRTRPLR